MKKTTAKYVWMTLVHKYFVFKAGRKTKAPIWQLLVHDLSKFSWHEAPHYGRQFYGDRGDPKAFARAWLHHQNHNPHHWEYWIPRTSHTSGVEDPEQDALEMPEPYVREMVADWMGAARTYTGEWPVRQTDWKWLDKNFNAIILHPKTRALVQQVLDEVIPR